MYFSDSVFGWSGLDVDHTRSEFLMSFGLCPWLFFGQDDEEEKCSGPPRTPLVRSALVELLRQNCNLKRLTLFGTVKLLQYERAGQEQYIIDASIVAS